MTGRRGHAVEVRLYAEDPSAGWQPQSGRLTRFDIPGVVAQFDIPGVAARFERLTLHGIRLDSGYEAGDEVGTHYDAMLAKVISWAPTREEAARRLAAVLRRARIHGLRTNRDLLVEVLTHPAFLAGNLSTDFLFEHDVRSVEDRQIPGTAVQQALMFFAAAVASVEETAGRRPVQQRIPTAFRNVVSAPQVTMFDHDGTRVRVGWYRGRDGYWLADVYDEVHDARVTSVEARSGSQRVVVQHDGVAHAFEVFVAGDHVDVESSLGHVALTRLPRFMDPADKVATGFLLAPMPGTVVRVGVGTGDEVVAGQAVLVLEAMKMQHTVSAPHDGVVTDVSVSTGDQVASGAVLAVVRRADPDHEAPEGELP